MGETNNIKGKGQNKKTRRAKRTSNHAMMKISLGESSRFFCLFLLAFKAVLVVLLATAQWPEIGMQLVRFAEASSTDEEMPQDLYLENCKKMELDFIVLEGEATQRAIEDDIAE